MKYEMKCPFCGKDMIYIKDKELESKGWVSMDCPDEEEELLVPINNPSLIKINTVSDKKSSKKHITINKDIQKKLDKITNMSSSLNTLDKKIELDPINSSHKKWFEEN